MSHSKTSKATGGHASVSNKSEESLHAEKEDFFVSESVFEEPSEGKVQKTAAVKDKGIEDVPGHVKTSMEAVTIAPDTSKFRDIGEASFGPFQETVHLPDDRIQITNTGVYPWSAHCSLLITAADNSQWIGTGWFIGPHTVMTAGHVVYIRGGAADGWVRSIQVMPGRNGNTLPFGSITSNSFRSVTGWTQWGDWNYDYGAIILPSDLGIRTGWFGFGVWSDSELTSSIGNLSGYPGDKPSGTQWYDWHQIASVDPRKVYYDIDTYGGQSGSAVYRIIYADNQAKRYGIAIHAYGGATTNSGTRIVTPVFNNMVAWKA
jgi:glutamyl endopeptidase